MLDDNTFGWCLSIMVSTNFGFIVTSKDHDSPSFFWFQPCVDAWCYTILASNHKVLPYPARPSRKDGAFEATVHPTVQNCSSVRMILGTRPLNFWLGLGKIFIHSALWYDVSSRPSKSSMSLKCIGITLWLSSMTFRERESRISHCSRNKLGARSVYRGAAQLVPTVASPINIFCVPDYFTM